MKRVKHDTLQKISEELKKLGNGFRVLLYIVLKLRLTIRRFTLMIHYFPLNVFCCFLEGARRIFFSNMLSHFKIFFGEQSILCPHQKLPPVLGEISYKQFIIFLTLNAILMIQELYSSSFTYCLIRWRRLRIARFVLQKRQFSFFLFSTPIPGKCAC